MRKIPAVLVATLSLLIVGLGYGFTGGIKRIIKHTKDQNKKGSQ